MRKEPWCLMVYRTTLVDDSNVMDIIAKRIKELRVNQNLTIDQLSDQTQISERMFGNYENARNLITIETIVKLFNAQVFEDHLDLEDLVNVLIVEPIKEANGIDEE